MYALIIWVFGETERTSWNMLQFEKSKNNGGFTLWGDYEDLKSLHSFAMDISDKSSVLEAEGLIPALAYDLRKAYEGQRKSDKTTIWNDEISIYGVEQVWPTFIMQVALLRTGLAFIDSKKFEQSQMYLLEGFLENAINTIFPKQSHHILACYSSLVGTPEKFITNVIGSRTSYFMSLNANERRIQLAEILQSMKPMWERRFEIFGSERMGVILSPKHFANHSWETVCDLEEL